MSLPSLKAQSLLYAPPTVPEYDNITYSLDVVTCMCLYDCHVTVFWKKREPTGVGSKKRRCFC